MKKRFIAVLWIILSIIGLSNHQTVYAESGRVIVVTTPLEFINAIGPDRVIHLNAEVFELPAHKIEISNRYVTQEKVNDGYQLRIHDVKNLSITGIGEKPVKLLAKPRYAYILVFSDSDNLKINKIEAGHTPGDFGCLSGVLNFINCRNIEINDSVLFGCGSEGVDLEDVVNFKFKNSIIKDCIFGIMNIRNSTNCEFEDSVFQGNVGWYLINIAQSEDINFSKCRIKDNISEDSDYGSIFDVSESERILISDCIVENNTAEWFAYRSAGLQMDNTPLDNNNFHQGDFYQVQNPYGEYYNELKNISALIHLEKIIGGKSGYDFKEEYRNTVNQLEKAKKNGTNYEVEYLLGAYYALGNKMKYDRSWDKAEECFRNSIALNPDFVKAHVGLADLYFDLCIIENIKYSGGDFYYIYTLNKPRPELMQEIIEEYMTAISLSTGELGRNILFRIFTVLCFQKRFDQALEFAQILVSALPEEHAFQNCLKIAEELIERKTAPKKIEITTKAGLE